MWNWICRSTGASVLIGEFYYKTDEGVKKCTYNPDKDNIIPICDEEYFSDDIVSRFCEWVKVVYGEKSLETNLDFIAKALGNKGNTSREVIRNYFLNDFSRIIAIHILLQVPVSVLFTGCLTVANRMDLRHLFICIVMMQTQSEE